MRKLLLVLVSAIFFTSFSYSQSSLGLQYSRNFGNTFIDRGLAVKRTPDGGSMAIGESNSQNGGDVTDNHGLNDIWVVKLNADGLLQWKKSYGGSSNDLYRGSIQNSDGSTVIFSQSLSNNGDVTGNHGGGDIWAFKIDGSGTVIWKRSLGGSQLDEFRYADTTADGGCIIAGYTSSNDGDVSGNHGSEDIWIVKLSSSGTIDFQKCLGGTGLERPRFIMTVPGNNYVMVGSTASGDGDVTGWHANNDLWVMRLGPTGNILWQKALGGSQSDTGFKGVLGDNGTLTVLANTSSVDGDVIGRNNNSTTLTDVWVVNLSFVDGSLNWQKPIGGSRQDVPVHILKNSDGSFLVLANSESGDGESATNHHAATYDILLTRLNANGSIAWSKCYGGSLDENVNDVFHERESDSYILAGTANSHDGDVTGYHVPRSTDTTDYVDAWILKVDHLGALQWQRCVGGSRPDVLYSIQRAATNQYYLVGETESFDGDIPKRNNLNYIDLWSVKIGFVNEVKGTVYLDANNNGIKDPGESIFTDAVVETRKGDVVKTSVPGSGLFIHEVDTGHYVTRVIPDKPYFTVVPSQATSDFTTYFNKDSFSFAVQVVPNKKDLTISSIALTNSRPGFPTSYKVFYKNAGTAPFPTFTVDFIKDHRLNFLSASRAVSSSEADTLKWNFTQQLNPGDTGSIVIQFAVPPPPAVNINDTLVSYAVIEPNDDDETPNNNLSVLKQRVTGSFDPNDKTESNGGIIPSSFIANNYSLQYTIRFQNTGTDTAFNVAVRDTLDAQLDWRTLEVVTASHPYLLSINNGNELTWQFNNINLPDSNINEPLSHGYIVFRIEPKNTVAVNDQIPNTASVYFDYNLPVLTNNASTLVQDNFSVLPVKLLSFNGRMLDKKVRLYWKAADAGEVKTFEVERSTDGRNFSKVGSRSAMTATAEYSFDDEVSVISSSIFFYRLKMVNKAGSSLYSEIIVFRDQKKNKGEMLFFPNPVHHEGFVSFFSAANGRAELQVIDISGRPVLTQYNEVFTGSNVISVKNLINLNAGVYTIKLNNGGQSYIARIIVH
jgi:uncharacterized repeat protein (TIGR01451 family)